MALLSLKPVQGQQNIKFGVFADPLISWYSSDTRSTSNAGSRAGFNFGFTLNKYFAKNYSFSLGLGLMNSGGNLKYADTVLIAFNNSTSKVNPGQAVNYRVQYIDVPLGLKFETNQIGYVIFFVDLGFDPKVRISAKADIPSNGVKKEAATNEINIFTMSYHAIAGIEYSLGGSTALVFGMGYENNFIDITKNTGLQPQDRIRQNILRFRLGVNF